MPEEGLRFSTVQEIMDYYCPDERVLSGEEAGREIAERLLADFRASLLTPLRVLAGVGSGVHRFVVGG